MQRPLATFIDSVAQRALLPLLLLSLAASMYLGYCILVYQPGYAIGDWLINYSAGFVRRGLPGEVFLLVGRVVRVPVPWLALLGSALLYAFFLYVTYRLTRPLRFNSLLFALLFSPAAIPFLVLNVLEIGYRKETMILAGLALVIVLLGKQVPDWALSISVMAVFAALMLSHEAMVICLPFFAAAVLLATRNVARTLRVCLPAFVVAGVMLVLVDRHPGDLHVAQAVCSSVGGQWVDTPTGEYPGMDWVHHQSLCSGAVAWLTVSRSGYHQQMVQTQTTYISMMTKRVILAFLPLVLALWQMYRRDGLRFEVTVIAITSSVCFVGVLALCYSTLDWGRWIYMWDVCTVLTILQAAQHAASFKKRAAAQPLWRTVALPLLTLAYCVTWTLPVNGGFRARNGYRDAIHNARSVIPFRRHQQASGETGLYGEPVSR